MWADSEADVDYLNYSEVAELIGDLVGEDALRPISLGVFGGWGTGKSTVLRLVEAEFKRTPDKYLLVKFDAWLHQDFDDARAALMAVIAAALIEASPESLKDKAVSLLGRVNKLRLLGLALEGGALALGFPTFGALTRGVSALEDMISEKPKAGDSDAVKSAATDVAAKAKGLVAPSHKKGPPEEIDAFRKEFGEILTGLEKTLVVFIDNLDRCLPNNAIHTLEAVRLFLFMPNTAFVVAADEDMIRHAVAQHFNNPSERHVADYLDKLIQVPVRVPRLGVQEVRAYMFLLLVDRSGASPAKREELRGFLIDQLRQSWNPSGVFGVADVIRILNSSDERLRADLEMADRMAPMLAHSSRVAGNPRIVKRMLNVVRMRTAIAARRSMPLDESIIAKLALFERCTDETAAEALHTAINESGDGKPGVLYRIEGQRNDAPLPEAWTKHLAFIEEWASLDPKLGGIDLRPAVYLARETVPLRIQATGMSAAAVKAVQVALKVASIASPAAKDALKAVPRGEMPAVMEAIVSELRKNSDWSRARADFRGAFIVAEFAPETGAILARFVRSLQLRRQPPWMASMLKEAAWAT